MKYIQLIIILLFISYKISLSQEIESRLDSVFKANQLMGMSVVAVCDTGMMHAWHFGESDYQRHIPVTDSTIFRVASISKSITATALMILYDRGMFSLDDDAGTWLGFSLRNQHFPDVPVTIRMILTHTSSLTDGLGYAAFLNDSYSNNPPPVLQQLLVEGGSYYTPDMFSSYAPGTYFSYANINYGIAGTLVERISGVRFDRFCIEEIFQPLGIIASFVVTDLPNINNVAVLYRYYNDHWAEQADNYQGIMPEPRDLSMYITGTNALIFAPQGGLRISAKDLAKFMLMHINYGHLGNTRILSDSTAHLMQQPQWTYNGSNGNYYDGLFRSWTLGFHRTTNQWYADIVFPFTAMTGHPGEAYGLISDMYFDSESRTGVIFITNGSKNPYAWGNSSAYYLPEEQVFNIIYHEVAIPCTGTLVKTMPVPFLISPNPFNSHLNITSENGPILAIQIFDITGRNVYTYEGTQNSIILQPDKLQTGIYALKVKKHDGWHTAKIVRW